jgi:sterol desaturase/sphingolipid hydroxylase (fatty acid hydroxylase superfamily)
MSPVDAIGLVVPVSFLALMAIEAAAPARAFPPRRRWRLLGIGFFVVMASVSTALPLAVPAEVIARYRVLDLSGLGPIGGFAVGWILYTLVGYVWHRACHASPLLWKAFHQMHHAPVRLDIASAAVFHPFEMVAYTGITVLTTVFLLGLDPIAAALIGTWGAFASFFQHMNVRTPPVLGYLVQRPEAHGLHHQVGGPAGNYADLPLWDIAFGTFRNPVAFEGAVGFEGGNDRRWGAMLGFVDVSEGGREEPATQSAGA